MARNRKRNRQRKKMKDMQQRMPMPMREGETPMHQGMGMMQPEGEDSEESNVSPEEQAIYHKFMENYYTVMYLGGKGEGGRDQPPLSEDVRQHFVNIKDPIDALANAALVVVRELAGSAEAAGKPIPGDVLMHAGTEVVEDLADLAEAGGHYDYDSKEITGAYTKAVDLFREMNQDRLNMDEIGQDYKTLMEADQAGRLEEVLPGARQAAEELPSPDEEEMAEPEVPQGGPGPQGFGRA